MKNSSLTPVGGGIAGTLDSSYYKGQGERQGIEREYIVICEGYDDYNLTMTGGVSITLQAARADSHHIPVVVIDEDDSDWNDSRPSDTENDL